MCCEGATNYARVSAINNAGIEGPFSPSSTGTVLLDPSADADLDGMTNTAEDFAGTNPLDPNSLLRILSLADANLLTWSSVSGRTYRVWSTADLAAGFAPASGTITASGPTTSWLDASSTNRVRFYRVNALP